MTETPKIPRNTSPFWDFSLATYARPGVPDACLTLQDGAGVDVNVLLFALFLGRSGRKLGPSDVRKIAQAIEPWRAGVVVALRQARRALKEPPPHFEGPLSEGLRKHVKAAELEAERIQQEMLFVTFPMSEMGEACTDAALAARANVDAYRDILGTNFNEQAVATLLSAAAQTKGEM